MAVWLRGLTSYANTTAAPDWPTPCPTTVAGDVLVAIVYTHNGSIFAPSGWTNVALVDYTSNPELNSYGVWFKVSTGASEPSSFTFQNEGVNEYASVIIASYGGVTASGQIVGCSLAASSTPSDVTSATLDIPEVTATGIGSTLAFFAFKNLGSLSFGAATSAGPSGYSIQGGQSSELTGSAVYSIASSEVASSGTVSATTTLVTFATVATNIPYVSGQIVIAAGTVNPAPAVFDAAVFDAVVFDTTEPVASGIAGDSSSTLDGFSQAAVGALAVAGASSSSLDSLGTSSTGSSTIAASSSSALGDVSQAAAGLVSAPTYDFGFNFRLSSAFVTDPAGTIYFTSGFTGAAYRYPTLQNVGGVSVQAGWTSAAQLLARDRSASIDPRLAGLLGDNNLSTGVFRITLPTSGEWQISLAVGDQSFAGSVAYYDILDSDGTTVLHSVGPTASMSVGQFYDAMGTLHTSAANWVANNQPRTITLSGTDFYFRLNNPATGSSVINHLRFYKAGSSGGSVSGSSSVTLGSISSSATAALQATGSSATTLSAFTSTSAAVLPVSGSSSSSLGALTQSAAAKLPIASSSATTLGTLTQASSSKLALAAGSATTLGALTQAATATGQVTALASSSSTLDAFTQSAAAAVAIRGSSSATLGAATATAAGVLPIAGASSSTLGSLAQSAVAAVSLRALASSTLDAVSATSAGRLALVASSSSTLGAVTQSATGTSVAVTLGASASTLGPVASSAAGKVAISGSSSQSLGAVTQSASSQVPILASSGATLGAVTSTGTSQSSRSGSSASTLGAMSSSSSASLSLRAASSSTLGPVTQVARNAPLVTDPRFIVAAPPRDLVGTSPRTLTAAASSRDITATSPRGFVAVASARNLESSA